MEMWKFFLKLLFPRHKECLVCGRTTSGSECLCKLCQGKIIKKGDVFCPVCGRYWPESYEWAPGHGISFPLCWDCLHSPPPFFAARSLGEYGSVLKDTIYLFKYRRHRSLADYLGRLLAELFLQEKAFHGTHLLVPVPLSIEKIKERGFNQCELLAAQTGRRLGIPVHSCLCKVKNTPSQSKLTRGFRRESVKGAFLSRVNLSGEQVLLIDDIFTTGATASECAKVLMQGGAGKVGVLTLAGGVLKKVEVDGANAGKSRNLSNSP